MLFVLFLSPCPLNNYWLCFSLPLLFSPKETLPSKPVKREKEQRPRHLLTDLPLPPELPGGDPSPPDSPEPKAITPPQQPYKKRPK